MFARTGATTGKSFLLKEYPPNSVFASYLIRVKLNSNISPNYIYIYFQSSQYWNNILKNKVGSTLGGFNAEKLFNLPIPLPPPNVQKSVALGLEKKLESVEKVKSALQEKLHALDAIPQAYLREVFG